jgi:[phosphatase 2A protein]-leucine-carboxy methyltransferase
MLSDRAMENLVYHEIDFPSNTAKKIAALRHSSHHLKMLQSEQEDAENNLMIAADGATLLSAKYNIHGLDLRSLIPSASETSEKGVGALLPNLSSTTPTLLLSECCLIYLQPSEVEGILEALTQTLIPAPTPLSLVIYEPIRPNDPFGKVMVSNLATRGIRLQTLKRYSSLFRQRERLRLAGFEQGQRAADVNYLWEQWIAESEKERLAQLEMLDETEEWTLLAQHYCVAWGWRGEHTEQSQRGDIFERAWEGLVAQQAEDEDDEGG